MYKVLPTIAGREPMIVTADQELVLRRDRVDIIRDTRLKDLGELSKQVNVRHIQPDPNGGNAVRDSADSKVFYYSNEEDLKAGTIAHVLSLPRSDQAETRFKNALLDQQGIAQRTTGSFQYRKTVNKTFYCKLFSWSGRTAPGKKADEEKDPNGNWAPVECADEDDAMEKLAEFKRKMGFTVTGDIDVQELEKAVKKKKKGGARILVGGIPNLWAVSYYGQFALQYQHEYDRNAKGQRSGKKVKGEAKEVTSDDGDKPRKTKASSSAKTPAVQVAASVDGRDVGDDLAAGRVTAAEEGESNGGQTVDGDAKQKKKRGRPAKRKEPVDRAQETYTYVLSPDVACSSSSSSASEDIELDRAASFFRKARELGGKVRLDNNVEDKIIQISMQDFLDLDEAEQKQWCIFVPDIVKFEFADDDEAQELSNSRASTPSRPQVHINGQASVVAAVTSGGATMYKVLPTIAGREPMIVTADQELVLRRDRVDIIRDTRLKDLGELSKQVNVRHIQPDPNGGNAVRDSADSKVFYYSNEEDLKAGTIAHVLSLPRSDQAETRFKNALLDQQGIAQRTTGSFQYRKTVNKTFYCKLFSWSGRTAPGKKADEEKDPNGNWAPVECADEDDAMEKLAEFKRKMGFTVTGDIDVQELEKAVKKKKKGGARILVGGIPNLWAVSYYGQFALQYQHEYDRNAKGQRSGKKVKGEAKEVTSDDGDKPRKTKASSSAKTPAVQVAASVDGRDVGDDLAAGRVTAAEEGESNGGQTVDGDAKQKKKRGRPAKRKEPVDRAQETYTYVLSPDVACSSSSSSASEDIELDRAASFFRKARELGGKVRLDNNVEDKIIQISMQDFLDLDEAEQKQWCIFVPDIVKFEFADDDEAQEYASSLPIDPYFLGLWLGDGSEASTTISNNHEVGITTFLSRYASARGMKLAKPPRAHDPTAHNLRYAIVSLTKKEKEEAAAAAAEEGSLDTDNMDESDTFDDMPALDAGGSPSLTSANSRSHAKRSSERPTLRLRGGASVVVLSSDTEDNERTSSNSPRLPTGTEELWPVAAWGRTFSSPSDADLLSSRSDPLQGMTAAERQAVQILSTPSQNSVEPLHAFQDDASQASVSAREQDLIRIRSEIQQAGADGQIAVASSSEAASSVQDLLSDGETIEFELEAMQEFRDIAPTPLDEAEMVNLIDGIVGPKDGDMSISASSASSASSSSSDIDKRNKPSTKTIKRRARGRVNDLLDNLRELNLSPQIGEPRLAAGRKHIPQMYLRSPTEVRQQVLAGLIDSDGCFQYDQKRSIRRFVFGQVRYAHERLFRDAQTLFRSLGLQSSGPHIVKAQTWISGGRVRNNQEQFRTHITGPLESIPTLLPRKQVPAMATERGDKKALSFKVEQESQPRKFFQIHVSGNALILRDDFVIIKATKFTPEEDDEMDFMDEDE
ncbi:hypothetical protein Rt10032_c04g2132 [Rhodotorula toruloides]|uniref:DOD-type homing endonuclease domain-containing protein n=1 Tax=Rhodotorula toruloides TaxID=5286 RepID=A0A511KDR3_RHOTO|nr:hypothetical protein Rt10032_c04g2132 [Rhodotorula toruloides]